MMVSDEAIGKALRAARKRKGWSQQNAGDVIDVSYQQIQKYEKGINRITLTHFVELASALDLQIAGKIRLWVCAENQKGT